MIERIIINKTKAITRKSRGGGAEPLNYFSSRILTNLSKNVLSKDYENFKDFSNSALKNCFKKDGFTLAEVLITLGIIGVVAALTMPSLIAHYKDKVLKNQLKKSLSVVNQAIRAGMAKEGLDSINLKSCVGGSPSFCSFIEENTKFVPHNNSNISYQSLYYVYTSSSISEMNKNILNSSDSTINSLIRTAYGSYLVCGVIAYQLTDGAIIGIPGFGNDPYFNSCSVPQGQKLEEAYIQSSLQHCMGFIDVNGSKGPNKLSVCNDKTSTKLEPSRRCKVGSGNVGDFYPVLFHDGIVEVATNAGAYILNEL